jgi:hypothetical protein
LRGIAVGAGQNAAVSGGGSRRGSRGDFCVGGVDVITLVVVVLWIDFLLDFLGIFFGDILLLDFLGIFFGYIFFWIDFCAVLFHLISRNSNSDQPIHMRLSKFKFKAYNHTLLFP